MGNTRGNLYSNEHESFDPNGHKYWAFSWEHMADHDLDAMIDHALFNSDNQKSLYYIGHSQGTLIMFSKLADNPKFGRKIGKFFALAPVGTVYDVAHLPRPLTETIEAIIDLIQTKIDTNICTEISFKFLKDSTLFSEFVTLVCEISQKLCQFLLEVVGGKSSIDQINRDRVTIYFNDYPAGTSFRNVWHFLLMKASGRHARMNTSSCLILSDYSYQLDRIETDIHLYWSPSDKLATEYDIKNYLLEELPRQILKENVELRGFAHQDFIWGNRAAAEIYIPIIETIRADLGETVIR
uniref:AB hydrolase-1 domain-containing protein n=1 Tax=Panagrellus redivivus TaxID=6233 RepID=A0A7E4VDR8_PANRE